MVVSTRRGKPLTPTTPSLDSQVVRVAKYRRRSTNSENQPYSIEAQDTRLDPYIASQPNWALVASYEDDKSGATLDRPDLQRALRDARAGKFDVLLVYRVDRLTRSIRGLLDVVDALDAAGVAFCSASEAFDTRSPVGRMTMQLLAVFAEFERALIIERVINGMEAKASTGAWTAGSHPYGYTTLKDPNTGKGTWLVPDDNAPLVRVIFELYAHQRMGVRSIANWLNQRGHRTQNGKPWGQTSVTLLLRSRAYIGEVYFRGTWYPAPHPHLIDRELFDTVQRLLDERGEDHARRAGAAADYLLAGLVKCARCGKRYVGTAANGKTQHYRYYTCFSRHRYGTDTCNADRLPADALEHAVLDSLLAVYQNTTLIEQAITQTRAQAAASSIDHQAELDSIAAALRRTNRAIDRYYTAFEDGELSGKQCAERVANLEAQRHQLHARQAELHAELATAELTTPDDRLLAELRSHITLAIRTGATPTAKGLLKAMVPGIIVKHRYAIHPTFRVPTGGNPMDGASSQVNGVRTIPSHDHITRLNPNTADLR